MIFKTSFHFFMTSITKKEKANGCGNPRRTGSGFKRMMIQPVVWRDGRSGASRPWKMRELR
ncbi:hypothetical protein B6J19_05415 [Klebsiella quasipneumoniae]|nr:hypothetical protein [Klebsiella quasipneumoniae]MBM5558898.1 hypothetical protein [Klebsiella quasipneumoniae]PLG93234.1 hypothetical protein B6J19_05415 [Klebsiella quasipneumoniae]